MCVFVCLCTQYVLPVFRSMKQPSHARITIPNTKVQCELTRQFILYAWQCELSHAIYPSHHKINTFCHFAVLTQSYFPIIFATTTTTTETLSIILSYFQSFIISFNWIFNYKYIMWMNASYSQCLNGMRVL